MKYRVLISLACLLFLAGSLSGAALILNEYNAVASGEFLGGDNSGKIDESFFGRVKGNGGNWLELVVLENHLDIRGWQLRWLENDGEADPTYSGPALWDPTHPDWSQGILTFSSHPVWSNLLAGTIITISEKDQLQTEREDGTPVTFDLETDLSFDPRLEPGAGDWHIHVSTNGERDRPDPLITTVTNVLGDEDGDFSVGNDDWSLIVYNTTDGVIDFGPIGEALDDFPGKVSKREAVRLEADPSPLVTIADYDDTTTTSFGAPNAWGNDPVHVQDFSSLRTIPEPFSLALFALGAVFTRRRNH